MKPTQLLCICLLVCAATGYAEYDITSGVGQVTAQYYDSPGGEGIINVVDHDSTTKYLTYHVTAWIQFHANAGYAVSSYSITSANDFPERDPSTWTLEGSNDGASWTALDTRTGEAFAGRFLTRRFTFTNTAGHSYYRLTMTCNSDRMQLAGWSLFTSVSHDVSASSVTLVQATPGAPAVPRVTVMNYGDNTESFSVTCLLDSAGTPVYSQSANVTSLAPGSSQVVVFPSRPVVGTSYTVRAWTALGADLVRGNDTVTYVMTPGLYNPAHDSIVYVVAGAHLDDQWQWTLASTIRDALPATLTDNFRLMGTYPEYHFSFEGAYRYWLMKRFYPARYDTLKSWVAADRWHYVGTFWDPCDVNIPSAEALIRQALYGTEFSMDEFGKRSVDIYLPDCFGFGYALPTIARHCGITGFSTQKFDGWGGFIPSPFSIGRWVGVDGSAVVASLKPGGYGGGLDIRYGDGDALRAVSGLWLTQDYVGTGDFGGSPSTADVDAMVARIRANSSNSVKVVCASADQLYRDLMPTNVAALPSYDGELLMTTHGTGCYTSWATMKLKNRRNEQRAAAAEFACVMGNWLSGGTFTYPMDTITAGWRQFLACQFHDVLTGTSIPAAYAIAQPMEDSAYSDFNYAFGLGNSAVANSAGQQLTTTVSAAGRVPVVVANPLAFERFDAVEAVVTFGSASHAGVKVYDPTGTEVPAQIAGSSGQYDTIVFVARVPSAGYTVFEAEAVAAANPPSAGLSIVTSAAGDTLQNVFYRVVVDANGDIASVYHKSSGHELLSAPSRLELRADNGTGYPAWEVTYADVSAAPTGYVDQGVVKTIRENGPARVSLQVSRTKSGSTFTQFIRLAADSAGARVDVANEVNWMTTGTLLKVGFPVTCANANATWDLGIGTIQRSNMTSSRYEVPGQQWADMTITGGTYGLSVLNDCKYGWNKESDAKLNLTLIHSPAGGSFDYQQDQSNVNFVGTHRFTYSFYGHAGTFTSGTVQQAAGLNQPVYAFQALPRNGAAGVKSLSFVRPNSPQAMVMAIKKAQKSNYYVVRVREAYGTAMPSARLTFGANITAAVEMNGVEEIITSATPFSTSGPDLTLALARYQPRTFGVTLSGSPQVSVRGPARAPRLGDLNAVTVCLGLPGNRGRAIFSLQPGDAVQSIRIIDASGRLIGRLAGTAARAYAWNAGGNTLGRGVYFVCLKTSSALMTQRLVMAR